MDTADEQSTGQISGNDPNPVSFESTSPSPEPSTPPPTLNISLPPVDRTPITYKLSGSQSYQSQHAHATKIQTTLERETRGHWVGPMDPSVFLQRYLPSGKGKRRPRFSGATFAELARATGELGMYLPFIKAIESFCPGLKLVDTHKRPDTIRDNFAVDISVYQTDFNGNCGITHCDFGQMEIPVEVKFHESDDPFVEYDSIPANNDQSHPFENRDNSSAMKARGQIASYSSALLNGQFRLHAFSVFVVGKWARLLRWDRNGVIVTQKFLFHEVDYLVDFFWRYAHTNDDGRGHDPTVVPIMPSHEPSPMEKLARDKLSGPNQRFHLDYRILSIPDRDTGEESAFLISYPPRYTTRSPFGRCTRSMLAFDIIQDKIVYIKDYWRSIGDNLEKEGDIYRTLEEAHVPYLAQFGKGNDIKDHSTVTDTVAGEEWAYPTGNMIPLRHYRMSLNEIGRPLNEFRSSHEALTAIADAMEAHRKAFTDAHILHRDISAGNILITAEGRGMLIDWDLCLDLNRQNANARRPNRTATWQFVSAYLLDDPTRNQTLRDDNESALYVILWLMLRYTDHNQLEQLFNALDIFDELSSDGQTGGSLKIAFITWKYQKYSFVQRPHLDGLIDQLCSVFISRYTDQPKAPLSEINWLVDTIRASLEQEGWPTDDKAKLNKITGGPSMTENQQNKHQREIEDRDLGGSSFKNARE